MKNTLKWIPVAGAILFGLLLMATLIFDRMWMGQYITSIGHGGMMYGGRHSAFGISPSYGWMFFGGVLLLMIVAGVVVANYSTTKANSASDVRKPYETCPACAIDLEPGWKYCPSCGFDLS